MLPPGNPGNYSAPTPISSLKHEKFPPNVFLFLSFKETICCGFKEGESFSSQLFCYKFCILQWFSFFLPWKMQNYQRNYQEFDFPPIAPTSNVLASLNRFFIGSHLWSISLAAEKPFLDSCCENREESFWKDAFDCLFAECCHTVGALVSGCAQRYKEKSERSFLMFMFRDCCKKSNKKLLVFISRVAYNRSKTVYLVSCVSHRSAYITSLIKHKKRLFKN